MTALNLEMVMRRSGMRVTSVPLPVQPKRDPSSLLLIADRAIEACGGFEPSFGDTPELAAAKALKRAALAVLGRGA